ncbi:hypothetical protein ACFL24_02875 [Patescibacteria group bacterium]
MITVAKAKKEKEQKKLYRVDFILELNGVAVDEITEYVKAYSDIQAVRITAIKYEEKNPNARVFLKDHEVNVIEEESPLPENFNPDRTEIPIETSADILHQYELDVRLELDEGCSDLELLRGIIVTGVKQGFFLTIKEYVKNGDWEKIAEIIQEDPNFSLKPKPSQPIHEPLFELY